MRFRPPLPQLLIGMAFLYVPLTISIPFTDWLIGRDLVIDGLVVAFFTVGGVFFFTNWLPLRPLSEEKKH